MLTVAKLDMWMSEFTHRIYIGRCHEVPHGIFAIEKKDATAQCINGAAAHLIAIGETDVIVTLDDGKYRIQITKVEVAPAIATSAPTGEESMINIQISYAADDSCQIQPWARGHFTDEEFLDACADALIKWDGRAGDLSGKPVKRLHWRSVRADAEIRQIGVCDTVFVESKPGRGAYAVTVLDEWLPLFLPTDGEVTTPQRI